MNKNMLGKVLAIILSFVILVCGISLNAAAVGDDVDIFVGDGVTTTVGKTAVFVNKEGQTVDSSDEYSLVTSKKNDADNTISLSLDYDDKSGVYAFDGWYDGATLISKEVNTSVAMGKYSNISARIITKNVLTHGASFEGVAAGNVKTPISNNTEGLYMYNASKGTYSLVPTGPAPSGHLWGMFTNFAYPTHKLVGGEYVALEGAYKKGAYNGDNMFPITAYHGPYQHTYYTDYNKDQTLTSTVTVTPRTGNVMIGMGQMYRSGIKELNGLSTYTDYELNLWVYQANPCGFVKSLVVTDHYDGIQTNGLAPFATDCNVLGASNYSQDTQVYGEWVKLTVPFSTTNKTTAYLHVSQNGLGTNGSRGMIFMDDLTVTESANGYLKGKDLAEGLAATQGVVTVSDNGANLNYTGSGLEFNLNCEGTLKAYFSPNVYNTNWDLRLAFHLNGERQNDLILAPGTTEVVLATGLEKGNYNIKLERMSEAQLGTIRLNHVVLSGEVKAPPEKKDTYIDFYGDSITAGWGTTYYTGNPTNPYQYMDGTVTYAAVTAKNLGANYAAFGYSGWGVCVTGANDGKGANTMTTIYPTLPKNKDADYVVVNLGTNDATKYAAAGLTEQQVKDGYLAYAKAIRADYGQDTPIIFAYGMMTDKANSFVNYAVDGMKALGDDMVYSVALPHGVSGGAGHPNIAQHKAAAEVLTAFIRSISATLAGDVDSNGEVNLDDVVCLAQKVAGWSVDASKDLADTDGSGTTDLNDVVSLAQYVAGWQDIALSGTVYDKYNPVSHTFKEIESKLKLNSRAAFDSNLLRMEWSYSGFTIQGQFSGDVAISGIDVTNQMLAHCIIDGDNENSKELVVNDGSLVIAKDLAPGFHTIQFVKATEASSAQMTVSGISYNGAIFPRPADKKLKIQVIGDSITSASGLYTAQVQPNALYRNDIMKGYAVKVANHFDADLSVVSVSGGTICTRTPSMQDYYKKAFFSKAGDYNFAGETKPDLVIIALGTNDTPTYNTNNVPNENVGVLKQGIKDMLALVRKNNPDATILWAYGMMATNISSVYKDAVTEFNATDGNTYYTMINRNDCTGSGGHPTPDGHTLNAKEFVAFIENNIWKD